MRGVVDDAHGRGAPLLEGHDVGAAEAGAGDARARRLEEAHDGLELRDRVGLPQVFRVHLQADDAGRADVGLDGGDVHPVVPMLLRIGA